LKERGWEMGSSKSERQAVMEEYAPWDEVGGFAYKKGKRYLEEVSHPHSTALQD
jgi:hypothetical protein